MARAYTQAAKRRHKKAAQESGLPEIAPVKRRATQGRKRMREIEAETPALQARCRQNGKDPYSDDDIRDMKSPWHGCNAGQAMASHVSSHADRLDLWDAIQHIRKTWVKFDAAIGAPRRHAQCLRLLLPMEAFETDADAPAHDDRTEDDKYRQAISAKMAVEGWLGYVESYAASVCKQVVIDDAHCQDPRALLRALHCVVDGIKGRKIEYRGA